MLLLKECLKEREAMEILRILRHNSFAALYTLSALHLQDVAKYIFYESLNNMLYPCINCWSVWEKNNASSNPLMYLC